MFDAFALRTLAGTCLAQVVTLFYLTAYFADGHPKRDVVQQHGACLLVGMLIAVVAAFVMRARPTRAVGMARAMLAIVVAALLNEMFWVKGMEAADRSGEASSMLLYALSSTATTTIAFWLVFHSYRVMAPTGHAKDA